MGASELVAALPREGRPAPGGEPARGRALPRAGLGGAHPVTSACPGEREVRRVRLLDAADPARAGAGHPAADRRPARRAVPAGRHQLGRGPGLRHRGAAMALAGLGLTVRAVDRDPVAVAVATVNLRPFPTASVHLGRAEGHDPTDTEGVWLDPARRAPARGGTRRLHDPEEYDPPLST